MSGDGKLGRRSYVAILKYLSVRYAALSAIQILCSEFYTVSKRAILCDVISIHFLSAVEF